MSAIDGPFVRALARIWHGIELDDGEAETLARMLAPMDAAAEHEARQLDFEAEPSAFELTMRRRGGTA